MLLFGALVFVGLVVTALSPRLAVMATGRLIVGIGAEVARDGDERGDRALVLARRAQPGVRRQDVVLPAGVLQRADVPDVGAPRATPTGSGRCSSRSGSVRFCLIGAVLYWILDSRGERRYELGTPAHKEKLVFREVFRFNRSFWLIAAAVRHLLRLHLPVPDVRAEVPDRSAARDAADGVAARRHGAACSRMIGMPLFGYLVDRYRQALALHDVRVAVARARVPDAGVHRHPAGHPDGDDGRRVRAGPGRACGRPSPTSSPDLALGSPTAMIDAIQQIGLVGINLLIGWSNDHWLASAANPAGYRPGMWMFSAFAVLAVSRAPAAPGRNGAARARAGDHHRATLNRRALFG